MSMSTHMSLNYQRQNGSYVPYIAAKNLPVYTPVDTDEPQIKLANRFIYPALSADTNMIVLLEKNGSRLGPFIPHGVFSMLIAQFPINRTVDTKVAKNLSKLVSVILKYNFKFDKDFFVYEEDNKTLVYLDGFRTGRFDSVTIPYFCMEKDQYGIYTSIKPDGDMIKRMEFMRTQFGL